MLPAVILRVIRAFPRAFIRAAIPSLARKRAQSLSLFSPSPPSAAMCRALILRAPLASVEDVAEEVDAMEMAEVEEPPLVRVLAHVESGLRAMMAHAFTVGVLGDELVDAAFALTSPVGGRRALQMRAAAARGLALLLRAAGQDSAEIDEWSDAPERRVRPRLE
jgi:hypothetical protein